MSNLLVVHHDDADGIVAALAVEHYAANQVDFFPTNYGRPYPDVHGRHVVIVDFSYPRRALEKMHFNAASLRLYDHHKSAQEELGDLPYCKFDINRSGCGLVWDELVGGPRPWLVSYVEDADLWRFALPNSLEVRAFLNSYLQTTDQFRLFFGAKRILGQASVVDTEVPSSAISQGPAILRYQQRLIEDAAAYAERRKFCPHIPHSIESDDVRMWCIDPVPCLEWPTRHLQSELASRLSVNNPFGAVFRYDPGEGMYVFSLRSVEGGADVSLIAKAYGGGGHQHAAGFRIAGLEEL